MPQANEASRPIEDLRLFEDAAGPVLAWVRAISRIP
jgi:hypothetical protein